MFKTNLKTRGPAAVLGLLLLLTVVDAGVPSERADTLRLELIGDFVVMSQAPYRWTVFEAGRRMFVDRPHEYRSAPPALNGRLTLMTANGDKYWEAVETTFISFVVKRDSVVYVLYHPRFTQLEDVWLNERYGWKREAFVVGTSQGGVKAKRQVRSRFFPGGSRVELGGTGCVMRNCDMYTVVVVPAPPAGETPAGHIP